MHFVNRFKRTFIGDRAFYRTVAKLIVPIIVQMFVTNFVNLLDNIMVGQLGTAELSGVAIGNQLIFVYNLCIFGGLSGPGIFGAQFYGAGDLEGLRNSFRMKLWVLLGIFAAFLTIFLGWGRDLVSLYLTGDGDPQTAQRMLGHGLDYLHIMLIGFLPFAFTTAYAGTLRETGETMVPMRAGIAAVLTNLVGNWLLIYGNLGFPKLGVQGAAIATVISRFVELAIIARAMHGNSGRFEFMHGVYRTLKVPLQLVKKILKKGSPLLLNEFLWSMGMATLNQIYSMRGLDVLAGMNIANTVNSMFNLFFISMGSAIATMIGQHLGANRMVAARRDVWRLMFFSAASCVVIGGIMMLASPYFPLLYNTTDHVRHLATSFMMVMALFMPMYSTSHACYFTLRSGGATFLTFLFDSGYMWVINIPLALALTHWTSIPIIWLYPLCELAGVIKMLIGLTIVRRGRWVKNIVH